MTQRIARRKLPDDRDRGFTLVELILVVVMLGLVTGVIAAAVIVFIKSEDGVVATAAESQDTRQVVNYFPLDIESGRGVSVVSGGMMPSRFCSSNVSSRCLSQP